MSGRPALSLVIATRNRAAFLPRLLARLLRLAPMLDWELVMVDNASSDETPQLLAQTRHAHLRAVLEPAPGKGRALNTGIAAASGELVVFSDDDIDPDPGWLEALSDAARRHPAVDCFGGRILVDEGRVPGWVLRSRNLHEILTTRHDLGDQELAYPPNRFPQGPNMAVRRSALQSVRSAWAADLGPGTAIPVGDEKSFFCRIGQGGGRRRIYVPAAVVRHHVDPQDLRLWPALRRCYWGGYSGALVESRHPEAKEPQASQSVLASLARTRSLRELACVAVRAAGYVRGRGNA